MPFGWTHSAGHYPLPAMEEYDPELFERIRAAVRAGSWQLVGGNWAETDQGLCTGESVVRNYLLGKRYFRERFGVDVKIAWQMEGSAYLATLPQVLRGFGFRGAVLGWHKFWGEGWRPVFRWRGADGSELPVVGLKHYFLAWEELPRWLEEAREIDAPWPPYRFAAVYGGGDHGGGPDWRFLHALRRQLQGMGVPAHTDRPPEDFFASLSEESLPLLTGHLHVTAYGGLSPVGLLTQHRIKRLNRECEHLLVSAEVLASLLRWLLPGEAPPSLVEAWQDLIFCQFHDIIWGSTSFQPYTEALARLEGVRGRAERALEETARRLLGRLDTRGEGWPIVVFNPLPWPRREVVALRVPRSALPEGEALEVATPTGQVVPVQTLAEDDGKNLLLFLTEVPPCGYRTFWLRPGQATGHQGVQVSVAHDAFILENGSLRVEVERRTGRLQVVEREGERFVSPEAPGFALRVYRDLGSAWSSDLRGVLWEEGEARSVRLSESGPVRARVVVEVDCPRGTLTKEIRLYAGLPWVELIVRGHWEWPRTQPVARFPLSAGELVTECPFGFTKWTRGAPGRELPQLRWAVAEGGGGGLALLNQGNHAILVGEAELMLPLLRTPPFVEQGRWVIHRQPEDAPEFNDLGPFEVRFALLPYRGTWREAGIAREGIGFNTPPRAWLAEAHRGALPAEFSLVSLEPESVLLSALKPAEDGEGLILRLYEAHGEPTQAVLRFSSPVAQIIEANLLEEPAGQVAEGVEELSLSLQAHQIETLRLVASSPHQAADP